MDAPRLSYERPRGVNAARDRPPLASTRRRRLMALRHGSLRGAFTLADSSLGRRPRPRRPSGAFLGDRSRPGGGASRGGDPLQDRLAPGSVRGRQGPVRRATRFPRADLSEGSPFARPRARDRRRSSLHLEGSRCVREARPADGAPGRGADRARDRREVGAPALRRSDRRRLRLGPRRSGRQGVPRLPDGGGGIAACGGISTSANGLPRLQRSRMPGNLPGGPRREMQALAPYMPFGKRLMLSNLWLFEPLVVRSLEKTPTTNALVRTTTAPTIFQSGVKENVLPSKARAVVNFRILPGESVESVLTHVRQVVADDRIEVGKIERMTSEPSPESSTASPAYHLLERTIRALFPNAVPAPSLVLGGTDSRHFAAVADDVYRFMPFRLGPEDLTRFHGTDERFAIEQIETAVEFYRRILRAQL